MATAKTAIKESLLGTTKEPELSTQSKATFNRHARQDDETQEPFMTQDDFVNAIAPPGEDYVSATNISHHFWQTRGMGETTDTPRTTAQDQQRTVRHIIPGCG